MKRSLVALLSVIAVVAMPWISGTAARAAQMTVYFTATDLVTDGDPFGVLGIAPEETVTGSFTFDPAAAPFLGGPTTILPGDPFFESTAALRPYVSFTVQVGSVALSGAPSPSLLDGFFIRDGTGSLVEHFFIASSGTDQALGGGVNIDSIELTVFSTVSDNPFDGTGVPSIDALNSMNTDESFTLALFDATGLAHRAVYGNVTFSAIPIPAALPLLGMGLAVMGLVGRRRRPRPA